MPNPFISNILMGRNAAELAHKGQCDEMSFSEVNDIDDVSDTSLDGDTHFTHSATVKVPSESGKQSTYRDFAQVPISNLPKGPLPTSMDIKFPVKLHRVLSNPMFGDIITWLPHGRSWMIVDQKAFKEIIMPLHFNRCKYSSFVRQVNGWGFKRITKGEDQDSFYHELFLRGLPHLCGRMRRLVSNGSRKSDSKDDKEDPNFYSMPVPDADGDQPALHSNSEVLREVIMRKLSSSHQENSDINSSPINSHKLDIALAQDLRISASSTSMGLSLDLLLPNRTNAVRSNDDVNGIIEYQLPRCEDVCGISHTNTELQSFQGYMKSSDSPFNKDDDSVSHRTKSVAKGQRAVAEKSPMNDYELGFGQNKVTPCLNPSLGMKPSLLRYDSSCNSGQSKCHLNSAYSETNVMSGDSLTSECIKTNTEREEALDDAKFKLLQGFSNRSDDSNDIEDGDEVSKKKNEAVGNQNTYDDCLHDHKHEDSVTHTNAKLHSLRECFDRSANINSITGNQSVAASSLLCNHGHLGLGQHDDIAHHISMIDLELLRRGYQNVKQPNTHTPPSGSIFSSKNNAREVPAQVPYAATRLSANGMPMHSALGLDTLGSVDLTGAGALALNSPPGYRIVWMPYEL